jgi:hypothetical protein
VAALHWVFLDVLAASCHHGQTSTVSTVRMSCKNSSKSCLAVTHVQRWDPVSTQVKSPPSPPPIVPLRKKRLEPSRDIIEDPPYLLLSLRFRGERLGIVTFSFAISSPAAADNCRPNAIAETKHGLLPRYSPRRVLPATMKVAYSVGLRLVTGQARIHRLHFWYLFACRHAHLCYVF